MVATTTMNNKIVSSSEKTCENLLDSEHTTLKHIMNEAHDNNRASEAVRVRMSIGGSFQQVSKPTM